MVECQMTIALAFRSFGRAQALDCGEDLGQFPAGHSANADRLRQGAVSDPAPPCRLGASEDGCAIAVAEQAFDTARTRSVRDAQSIAFHLQSRVAEARGCVFSGKGLGHCSALHLFACRRLWLRRAEN